MPIVLDGDCKEVTFTVYTVCRWPSEDTHPISDDVEQYSPAQQRGRYIGIAVTKAMRGSTCPTFLNDRALICVPADMSSPAPLIADVAVILKGIAYLKAALSIPANKTEHYCVALDRFCSQHPGVFDKRYSLKIAAAIDSGFWVMQPCEDPWVAEFKAISSLFRYAAYNEGCVITK